MAKTADSKSKNESKKNTEKTVEKNKNKPKKKKEKEPQDVESKDAPKRTARKHNSSFVTFVPNMIRNVDTTGGATAETRHIFSNVIIDCITRITNVSNALKNTTGKMTLTFETIKTAVNILFSYNPNFASELNIGAEKSLKRFLDAKKSNKGEGKKMSMQKYASIVISVSRAMDIVKQHSLYTRHSTKAKVYLAAVINAFIYRLVTLALKKSHDQNKKRISPRHITLAVSEAEDTFVPFFKNTVLGGGVIENIYDDIRSNEFGFVLKENCIKEYQDITFDEPLFSNRSIKKLARRAGISRNSKNIYGIIFKKFIEKLQPIVFSIGEIRNYQNLKTVMSEHVNTALKLHGITVYATYMPRLNREHTTKSQNVFNRTPNYEPSKKTGSNAIKEIKFYQKNSDSLVIQKAPFRKLVQHLLTNNDCSIQSRALNILQLAMEDYVVKILQRAVVSSLSNERTTTTCVDVNVVTQ